MGVYATKNFDVGDIVMRGDIIKRVKKNHSHASQINETTYVEHAGLISKVNHSCDPNCGIGTNNSGGHDFICFKTINSGEEITFDYAMRNFTIEYFHKECKCEAVQCRGQITGWKTLPEKIKKEYQGFIAPYLNGLDLKKN